MKYLMIALMLYAMPSFASNASDSKKGVTILVQTSFGNYEKPIPKDQIKGKCKYKGTYCKGAEIILLNNTLVVDKKKIDEEYTFVFSKLEKAKKYQIKVNFQGVLSKEVSATTGQEIVLTLIDSVK